MEFFVYNLDKEHSENVYASSAGKYRDLEPGKRPARLHMKDEDGNEFILQVGQRIKSLRKNSPNPARRIWEEMDSAIVVTIISALDFDVMTTAKFDLAVRKSSDWDPEFRILREQVIESWNFEELEDENASMPM